MRRKADYEILEAERLLRESKLITRESAKEYGTINTLEQTSEFSGRQSVVMANQALQKA